MLTHPKIPLRGGKGLTIVIFSYGALRAEIPNNTPGGSAAQQSGPSHRELCRGQCTQLRNSSKVREPPVPQTANEHHVQHPQTLSRCLLMSGPKRSF